MGENSVKLNLDSRSVDFPKTISELLTEVSVIADISEKSSKLNGYVKILEQELRKIHAFKRELPLCMLLLNDAIERLKEESNSEKDAGAKTPSDFSDKKNWMRSAQLWSASNVKCEKNCRDVNKQVSVLSLKLRDRAEDGSATENPFQHCNFRNRGGAFLPLKGPSGLAMKAGKVALPVQGLSLLKPVAEMGPIDLNLEGCRNSTDSGSSSLTDQMKLRSKPKQQQQQQKKQRRCWSPELHRRFVDALQQLGGAQTATPKHIRELMQVDSLSNDEVKSHLQKYRIHVQKLSASSAVTSTGLRMSRGRCGDVSKANHSQSGSPLGPLHLGGSAKGVSIAHGDNMDEEKEEK